MSRWAMTRKMSSYSCSGGTICGENGSSRELAQLVARRRAAPGRPGAAARRTGRRRRSRGAAPRRRKLDHLGRRVVGDLQAHGAAALAPPQLLLDRLEEVVGLVLVDRQVEVARDAERRCSRARGSRGTARPRAW